MIEVRDLTKKYGDNLAVRGLSFNIEKGKIYGLLGPNGAGKSTTMNIMTGCLAATSGTVLIDGHDIFEEPLEAKRHIGYLPEQPPLYTDMTAAEYLDFVASAKGVPYEASIRQIKEVMTLTGILDVSDRLLKNLSKGYRQRVGIAQAMIGDPDVIILDEPTVGLDPKQIIEIRELIKKLGTIKTVIISSHILAEISAVCDHVMIISRGRLVANAPIGELEDSVERANDLHLKIRGSRAATERILGGIRGILSAEFTEEAGITSASIKTAKNTDARDDIFFAFAEEHMPVIEMVYHVLTLEDIFLALTSDNGSDEDAPHTAAAKLAGAAASGITANTKAENDVRTNDTAKPARRLFSKKARREAADESYTPQFGGQQDESEDDR